MAYVTQAQLRAVLRLKLAKRNNRQVDLAREIGIKQQNLSIALKGAPIGGKILDFLGYERVDGLYRKQRSGCRRVKR
jgi:hypothetical protein